MVFSVWLVMCKAGVILLLELVGVSGWCGGITGTEMGPWMLISNDGWQYHWSTADISDPQRRSLIHSGCQWSTAEVSDPQQTSLIHRQTLLIHGIDPITDWHSFNADTQRAAVWPPELCPVQLPPLYRLNLRWIQPMGYGWDSRNDISRMRASVQFQT